MHVSPRIMMVAVPTPQHSPIFGHLASAQTVLRSSRSTTSARSLARSLVWSRI